MTPWHDVIGADELRAYEAAGFGRPSGLGQRPAADLQALDPLHAQRKQP